MDVAERQTKQWAAQQAMFANAHFRKDGPPFEAEDFLGTGNREQRVIEFKAAQLKAKADLLKMQRSLGGITKESDAAQLPSWAKRQWDPKDYPHLFGGAKN